MSARSRRLDSLSREVNHDRTGHAGPPSPAAEQLGGRTYAGAGRGSGGGLSFAPKSRRSHRASAQRRRPGAARYTGRSTPAGLVCMDALRECTLHGGCTRALPHPSVRGPHTRKTHPRTPDLVDARPQLETTALGELGARAPRERAEAPSSWWWVAPLTSTHARGRILG